MDFCSEKVAKMVQVTNNPAQFSAHNGITVTRIEDGVAEGELAITPQTLNHMGIVHGGCLATLADTVAGVAVDAQQQMLCVTVNYSLSFLRPAHGEGKKIYCKATPHKLGRTLCVYGVSLTDDDGKEVAAGSFTFFLTGPIV